MKTISCVALIFFTSFFSYCQSNHRNENSTSNSQTRNVENFTGIKVQNAITLELTQGNANSVTVNTSNTDDQEKVITEVNNGILLIKLENAKWSWKNRKVLVQVSIQNIESLDASGATCVKITNSLLSKDLRLKLSGASSLKGEIKALKLDAEISGASSVKISGISENANIKASGASDFKAYDFVCENAIIEASGASEVNLSVQKSLNANASGASSINYKGNPTNKIVKSNGASSINQKEN